MALSVTLVTIVNVFTNLAYFVVVPPAEIASSDAVAVVNDPIINESLKIILHRYFTYVL